MADLHIRRPGRLGDGEHGLTIDLGLGLLTAGDPQEEGQDLFADLAGGLPGQDGSSVEVDVVRHGLKELRVGGDLDHRHGRESHRGASAGGEQDSLSPGAAMPAMLSMS